MGAALKKKREPKLNVQGLARREKGLMSCLLPESGHSFVSVDLSAGEPTVTTHFSGDPMYRYACFDGVGKTPFYSPQNVLMIDDIYLMTMSVSPIGRIKMLEAFHATYNGLTFLEQWAKDPEYIQKQVLKLERQIHKILALALSYGMGPKKMVKSAYEAGYSLSLEDARKFFAAYWKLFERIARLGKYLETQFHKQGHLINAFGYRLVPDKKEAYKCLNYFIQSSVSGIMHVLCMKFFAVAPFCRFVTCIHDELIYEVPTERIEDSKKLITLATDSMNKDLKWSVNIRTGFAPGNNLYEAK